MFDLDESRHFFGEQKGATWCNSSKVKVFTLVSSLQFIAYDCHEVGEQTLTPCCDMAAPDSSATD